MGALDTWVRQLAAVVLLAGMVETLLPGGGLRGYARALLSLLVLLVVLQPVLGFAQGRLRLSLPGFANAAAAAPAQGASAQAEQAAAGAYTRLVAQGAQALVAGVPGVLAARVALTFSAAQGGVPPAVLAASVAVTPAATGAGVGALAEQVRATLSAGLELPSSRVTVSIA